MSTRKGQNSILFLATLGVYLGLVLVGAPHVLAQAATTKQFDVKDEIEKKDDLDKKPRDQNSIEPVEPLDHIGDELLNFYVQGLSRSIQGYSYGRSNGYELSFNIESAEHCGEGFAYLFPKLSKTVCAEFAVLRINEDGFYSKLSVTPRSGQLDASNLYSAIRSGIHTLRANQALDTNRLVAERTSVSKRNDQVFIITYLPRGSLESLLAKDAK